MQPPKPAVAAGVLPGEESLRIVSRAVQWRIDMPSIFNPKTSCRREFKLANCTWCLELKEKRPPQIPNYGWNGGYATLSESYTLILSVLDSGNQYVHAQFDLRVAHGSMTWQSCFSAVRKEWFKKGEYSFEHTIDGMKDKRLVIDFELFDVKLGLSPDKVLALKSLEEETQPTVTTFQGPLKCLSRMFTEALHTDVTINAKNGTLSAHRAVLAASSSVFACMFDNDFKEKHSSTIDIQDMSVESCKAFLSYLYGVLKDKDLWEHKNSLLEASHKYGIMMLQNTCEESLTQDINLSNVLERLSKAHFYELKILKEVCFKYLFELGRVYALTDKFSSFILDADRELATEIIWRMLAK